MNNLLCLLYHISVHIFPTSLIDINPSNLLLLSILKYIAGSHECSYGPLLSRIEMSVILVTFFFTPNAHPSDHRRHCAGHWIVCVDVEFTCQREAEVKRSEDKEIQNYTL